MRPVSNPFYRFFLKPICKKGGGNVRHPQTTVLFAVILPIEIVENFYAFYFKFQSEIFCFLIFKLDYRLGKTSHIFFPSFSNIMKYVAQNNNIDCCSQAESQTTNNRYIKETRHHESI